MELDLHFPNTKDKQRIAPFLSFLTKDDIKTREDFLTVGYELYHGPFALHNYDYYYGSALLNSKTRFFTIMLFDEGNISEEIKKNISPVAYSESYFGLAIVESTAQVYVIRFHDKCSPNWNKEYVISWCAPLKYFDSPILQEGKSFSRIDSNLLEALNRRYFELRPKVTHNEGKIQVIIKSDNGAYDILEDKDIESLFRNFADNYTGYKNYRRPDAVEWEIVDKGTKEEFESWKRTATGLKSSFDKFYGSGIVD